jgi:hypothetical protein
MNTRPASLTVPAGAILRMAGRALLRAAQAADGDRTTVIKRPVGRLRFRLRRRHARPVSYPDPAFLGLFAGPPDMAERAKDIARGRETGNA